MKAPKDQTVEELAGNAADLVAEACNMATAAEITESPGERAAFQDAANACMTLHANVLLELAKRALAS